MTGPRKNKRQVLSRRFRASKTEDDHADFRTCAAGFLEPEFELVASVGDGQALIRAADEHDPDLLLVDVCMPVFDGFEAVRLLNLNASYMLFMFSTKLWSVARGLEVFAGLRGCRSS